MALIDERVLAWAIRYNDISSLQKLGVSDIDFQGDCKTVWKYLRRMKREHDTLPSRTTVLARFPDLELPKTRRDELPMLLDELRKRTKYFKFMTTLNDTVGSAIDYENVEDRIQELTGQLNLLAYENTGKSHLVDLFDPEQAKVILQDYKRRRRGEARGIPTGLTRFDRENLGLQKGKAVLAIGRTGIGKSWLDLLIMAHAVMSGHKVILYPLEMSLIETAYRLYTIFSSEMLGANRAIKNLDLTRGNINARKVVKLMGLLEDKFAGQLYVADVAVLSEIYTMERIEAEVESLKPDMFWVDYLTLVKTVGDRDDSAWQAAGRLADGIKGIAGRRNVVGGASAQVNREALKARVFLPRPEHIAHGDVIGHPMDIIFSLNRKDDHLYYAVVKNRGGAEISKVRMKFQPNSGVIKETQHQGDDDDD